MSNPPGNQPEPHLGLDDHVSRKPHHRLAARIPRALALITRTVFATGIVIAARKPSSIRKFAFGWIVSLAAIWSVAGAYLLVVKPTYTSRWSLILPTAASGVSLQLESIGHAQTIPSSPFGSSSLSPKVIYKEIISSEQVRLAAARSLNMTLPEFGAARIKLIDETALMLFEITGRTPTLARDKARALSEAFHRQLDALRRDEIQRRAEVVRESLKSYESNLRTARDRIHAHQQQTGVLSINQFNEISTSLELMRRKITDVRADIGRLTIERQRLSHETGIDPDLASAILRLSADPTFNKMAAEYADSAAALNADGGRYGSANPLLQVSYRRHSAATGKLRELGNAAGLNDPDMIGRALLVGNGTHRSELVKSLLTTSATIAGRSRELESLESEFAKLGEDVTRMSAGAARLEDLKKDHLVAEAVFTSALARLDTNKVDIYASYPMVQSLAEPDLPEARSSPNTLLGIGGAILASLLALGAWGMAWLRHLFVRNHLKSA